MKRFLPLALCLLALAGPLAGCDLTTDQGTASGPTVQFGATSLTAPEGATAQIPVTLTGAAPGQTVTFDVLFAAGSSSACAEGDSSPDNDGACLPPAPGAVDTTRVDFTGFGQPSTNNNRVQSVSITADADGRGTATVDIAVRDEGAIESAQLAVFAIQNLSDGVQLGANRQISLVVGTLPIATIRQLPDNASATIEGIVTRARGRFIWVQDATAAIVIFAPADTPINLAVARGEIQPGDRIQVKGRTDIFRSLYELSFVTDFAVIAEDEGIPQPQTVSLAQLAADLNQYQSELIRIPGITIQSTDTVFDTGGSSGINYTITDASGTPFILRVARAPDSDAVGTPIPRGPTTFTGVLGQFNADGQLTLVNRSDLNP